MDTTDTDVYPVGTGIGSVLPVLTWQQITQVLQSAASGGRPAVLQLLVP
ncbi:phage tail protein [Ralstonia pseudosolanacearum]|nr:phage tail protein [Ralstonia sp. RS642]